MTTELGWTGREVDYFDLDAFAVHCRASAAEGALADAVDAALKQSRRCIGTYKPTLILESLLTTLNNDERHSMLESIAAVFSFGTLSVVWPAVHQQSTDFKEFQGLVNAVLSRFSGIRCVKLQLDQGEAVVRSRFRADFLQPSGCAALKTIQVSIARCWIKAVSRLIPALRTYREVHLDYLSGVHPEDYLGIDFLSALLRPGSSMTHLILPTSIQLFNNDKDCVMELAKALKRTDCKLEVLHVCTIGEDETMRSFFSALAENKSLVRLTLYSDTCSMATVLRASSMVALNNTMRSFIWSAAAPDEDISYLALSTSVGLSTALEEVELSCSGFNDEAAVHLSRLLQQPGRQHTLRRLCLSKTFVSGEGALALVGTPALTHLDLSVTDIVGDTICSMVERYHQLPNLVVSSKDVGAAGAVAIGSTIGLHSIAICESSDTIRIMETHSLANSGARAFNYVPGCVIAASSGTRRAIRLFAHNAQLKHIWYLDCTSLDDKDAAELNLYQTLNRKIPTALREKMIAAAPLQLMEWCDALGAVTDESIDCVYHVVSKWRLEGTSHFLAVPAKRKSRATKSKGKKPRVD